MKNVLVRGPLLSLSGYGNHARQVFRWLSQKSELKMHAQITPWGMTPWLINPDLEKGLVSKIMECSDMPQVPLDISFQIQLPNEWDSNIAAYNVGISAFVETDKCNPEWIQCCNKMDHIVVPSQHVKSVMDATGSVKVPVSVIPEAFFDEIANEDPSELDFLNLTTSFNLLIFGQITGSNPWSDRKNTFFTIKWLCEVFKDDPSAGIILKTNHGTNTHIDRRITSDMLEKLLKEVRPGPFPKVYLLHGHMYPEEINSLYRHPKIKALVSATRGEGFGLPLLEAAAASLPVIATDWSGHLDFLKKGKFISLAYDLCEIHESKRDNAIFIPGTKWAEVREEDFKKRIIKFRKSNKLPKEWAAELSAKLLKSHSFKAISEIYDSAFEGII